MAVSSRARHVHHWHLATPRLTRARVVAVRNAAILALCALLAGGLLAGVWRALPPRPLASAALDA